MEKFNRPIWCFREPRSGSSWFVRYIQNNLGKNRLFFDLDIPFFSKTDVYTIPHSESKKEQILNFFKERNQQQIDSKYILCTHEFIALESLRNYNDPVLFRNCRRNKNNFRKIKKLKPFG